MDFSTRYANLNSAQKQAVDHINGPLMVIAGPGTGKTELLSMRAANILKKTDSLAENILCLTFTESGADAMRQRLTKIIGADAYKVAIHTFHSFGSEIINQNGEFFYRGAEFRPADELTTHGVIHPLFEALPHNSPLASKMNGDFTYIKDTLSAISEFKKSGLLGDELRQIIAANEAILDEIEPLVQPIFAGRVSAKTVSELSKVCEQINEFDDTPPHTGISSFIEVVRDSLALCLLQADELGKTTPVTAWKNQWLTKNDVGNFVFKARDRHKKLEAVSYIYDQYLTAMQTAQRFDFDDMILRVVHALEAFPELRLNLQERYQYIMVDEFQDTNLAQMRILLQLTENDPDNTPNIMVVGDDDQAIYSFQGADVGNIHEFRRQFPQSSHIVLTDNYRSAPTVLEHARAVITQGGNRLENTIEALNKTLTPHVSPKNSDVIFERTATQSAERHQLVATIAKEIENGIAPESIAVLARRHYELEALVPLFSSRGIAVRYERQDDVFALEPIQLLLQLARIIVFLAEGSVQRADVLLPKLLSHPAFKISASELWKLSTTAHDAHTRWLDTMATMPQFEALHGWLIEQAAHVHHTPLETMIDLLIGRNDETPGYHSPLFEYFFSPALLDTSPDTYTAYLDALRTLRTKLRDMPGDELLLQHLCELADQYESMGASLRIIRTVEPNGAVQLMTAHKSKGLEFEIVHLIGAVDSAWGEKVRSRSRHISYPENLPLAPAGDSYDERLRLFFVAMTRAKRQLVISYAQKDDSGKSLMPASFLEAAGWQWTDVKSDANEPLYSAAEAAWYQSVIHPIESTKRDVLAPILAKYKLSATHLNAFLNISRGGPEAFLIHNLLRFPQAMSAEASYGTAVHATLQRAHAHYIAKGEYREINALLNDFEEQLQRHHLTPLDYEAMLQKGRDTLPAFIAEIQPSFTRQQKVELNFAGQNAVIGEANLTGSLDLVTFEDDSLAVTDYKTGSPSLSWKGTTDYEKIKLHHYRQQLMFYALLVRHSRDFGRYEVKNSAISFVQPTKSGEFITLSTQFTNQELTDFSQLIQAVYRHITSLDIPDTSHYPPTLQGILAFEAAILQGL